MNNNLIVGHNINTSHGFLSAISYAEKTDSNVFQIFLSSPKKWKGKRHTSDELKIFGQRIIKKNIKVLVHGNLMINFCQPIGSDISTKSCYSLIQDLNESVIINSLGVVIHMGHNVKSINLSTSDAIKNYVNSVIYCLDHSSPLSTIILETGAGQGNEICTSVIELSKMYNMFQKKYKDRIKICIDTCHIYASGYNLGDVEYVKVLIEHINIYLGWNNVVAIHLNDSKFDLNCRKDRHADLGKGCIELNGLKAFIYRCYMQNIPLILETPAEMHYNREQINYKIKDIDNTSFMNNNIINDKPIQFSHHSQVLLIKKWIIEYNI